MRRTALSLILLSCAFATPTANAQDLAAAIAGALANAPTLAEAEAGTAAANARLDRARAEANPALRIDATAGLGRIDNGGFFGITADNVTPLAVQATAEMPLFAGGRISAGIDQATGRAKAARFGQDQVRLRTVVEMVRTYADLLAARKLVVRFVQLGEALDEADRQAGLRFKVGEISSSDLSQAHARKAEAEAGLARAQGSLASLEAAFARLTGMPAGDLNPLPPLPATPPSLDEALDLARAAYPGLLQARAGHTAAAAGAKAARAERLPNLGLYAEAGHVRDQFFPGYRADAASVGVRGRWSLWTGGRTSAQMRIADAEVDAAAARVRQAEQAVDAMVVDTWAGLAAAREATRAAGLRSVYAEEALRATRLEVQVGAKPMLAELDAEREAIEAQASLLQAEAAQAAAAWQLKALTDPSSL